MRTSRGREAPLICPSRCRKPILHRGVPFPVEDILQVVPRRIPQFTSNIPKCHQWKFNSWLCFSEAATCPGPGFRSTEPSPLHKPCSHAGCAPPDLPRRRSSSRAGNARSEGRAESMGLSGSPQADRAGAESSTRSAAQGCTGGSAVPPLRFAQRPSDQPGGDTCGRSAATRRAAPSCPRWRSAERSLRRVGQLAGLRSGRPGRGPRRARRRQRRQRPRRARRHDRND